MAITLKNLGRISSVQTPTGFVGAKFTLSAFVRIDSITKSAALIKGGNGFMFVAIKSVDQPGTYSGDFRVYFPGTPSSVLATAPNMSVGATYHILFVYDKDDPARCFFAVNGIRYPIASGGRSIAGLSRAWHIQAGDDNSGPVTCDATIDQLAAVDGHAASDDDIAPFLTAGPAATAAFVDSVAGMSGVRPIYWTFAGDAGTNIQAGDPGVRWGANQEDWLAPKSVSDLATYTAPVAYDPDMRVMRAYVGSSGRTITMIMGAAVGDSRVIPAAPDAAAPVSVRVDGGAPLPLGMTPTEGAYIVPGADAVFFALPPGVVVTPNQVVTVSAARGWLRGSSSIAAEIADLPIENFAGMPISKGLRPDSRPARVGFNGGRSGPETLYNIPILKNRAVNIGWGTSEYWPDGTLKGHQDLRLGTNGRANKLDDVGIPGMDGLWVVRWDDHDPSNPVDITLSGTEAVAVERFEFRNEGDGTGRGKARVYEIQPGFKGDFQLAAAIDAGADVIPYTGEVAYGARYLELGGELIRIGATDPTLKRFTGCERGWRGTTATSHAFAAKGAARTFAQFFDVYIRITSSDKPNTHYANLAVYDPMSWTPPSEPGAVTIPAPTVDDNLEVHPHLRAILGEGVGCLRHIQTIPTQSGDWDEVEQFAPPEALHIQRTRVVDKFHIASVRAYDPVESPYLYSSSPYTPNMETYGATLGAPITTAPPPGTIETITIANGRDTPVITGQILFAGDEKIRVITMPLAGDEYEVERGAIGTATSTHPAGPITVGYRLPVTTPTQYTIAPMGTFHRYEAIFDETLSSPLRFGRAPVLDSPLADDGNLTIQRTLTLTAPLAAKALDIYAATADPADWDVVAHNALVKIGSETLTVVSVDPVVGKITVKSRPSGSTSHATGAEARITSTGVLFASADGTKKSYQPLFGSVSASMFPTGADRALIITPTVDPKGAVFLNESGSPAFPQTFDPAKATTLRETFPLPRTSYAHVARQTALADDAWMWMNVPLRATDAAVYEAARQVRDNFPAGRKVIFELSNEVWNEALSFAQSRRNQILSFVSGYLDRRPWFLARSKIAHAIVKACFAEVGRGDEVLLAVCWQTGSEILASCRAVDVEPDVYGIAPYQTAPSTVPNTGMFNALDREQLCDFHTFLMYYTHSDYLRKIGGRMKQSIADHEAITGRRPMAVTYEGGVESVVNPGSAGVVDPQCRKSRDVVASPSFYFSEWDTYAAIQEFLGAELINVYAITAPRLDDVSAGIRLWSTLSGPTQVIGRGDGRDGGANNLQYSFMDLPDDLRDGPDRHWEAVRAQAMLDWERERRGGMEPEPVAPGGGLTSKAKRFPIPSRARYRFG